MKEKQNDPIKVLSGSNAFDFAYLLRQRPGMFVEGDSIEELIGFIRGYSYNYSQWETGTTNPWYVFKTFKLWIFNKYPINREDTFLVMIEQIKGLSEKSERSYLDEFWAQWDMFCEEEQKRLEDSETSHLG